ncbi:M20/M25/M40 family metallo-hydrolase [Methanoculleus sp.]|uniref:M28 family metallopeptidase n=1 Tax=Methanoculleus sp. TaxID=90427 RepID=UPI0025F016F3|nr:M20/M25/M40 family metallo-hydrolase [Methanoculleus sp.]
MPSLACLRFVLLAVAVSLVPAAAAADLSSGSAYDPGVAALLAEINESELRKTASDLQEIPTRAFGSGGNREAGDYIYRRLADIPGLDVEFQAGEVRNVIARLPGSANTSTEIVVVGAHYDSRSFDPARAPGITDNGCGVAVVLELARVMSRHSFDRTVEFAFWNAEENGRHGSRRYVANISAPVALYLNYDSTCLGEGDRPRLNLLYNRGAREAAELMVHHNTLYGTNFTLTRNAAPFMSDHISFWARGHPAMMAHALPQWPAHTPDDTVDRASFEFAGKNARLGLSVLAKVAGMEGIAPVATGESGAVPWPEGWADNPAIPVMPRNGAAIHRAGEDGYHPAVRLSSSGAIWACGCSL